MVELRQHLAMVVGDGNREGGPLPPSKGETEFPGVEIEVKALRRNPNERSTDVRGSTCDTLSKTAPMSGGQGEGDLGGGKPDPSRDSRLQGSHPRIPGDTSVGRNASSEHFPQTFVHQETKVLHQPSDRRGNGSWLISNCREMVDARHMSDRARKVRRQWEHERPAWVHDGSHRP
jgi:hypothetical protein